MSSIALQLSDDQPIPPNYENNQPDLPSPITDQSHSQPHSEPDANSTENHDNHQENRQDVDREKINAGRNAVKQVKQLTQDSLNQYFIIFH